MPLPTTRSGVKDRERRPAELAVGPAYTGPGIWGCPANDPRGRIFPTLLARFLLNAIAVTVRREPASRFDNDLEMPMHEAYSPKERRARPWS